MRGTLAPALILVGVVLSGCAPGRGRVVSPAEIAEGDGWTLVRGVPLVRQGSERDCGAAAAAMVLRYWGVMVSPGDVAAAQPSMGERGLRAGDLRDFIRTRGLDAFVVKGEPGDLRTEVEHRRPLIVGLARGAGAEAVAHYEVVIGFQRERHRIVTLDPAAGWRESSYETFAAEWATTRQVALVVFRRAP